MAAHFPSPELFPAFYILGLFAGSLIRFCFTRGKRKVRSAENWSSRADPLLLFLVSVGMLVLPLVYLLTPWLEGFDYALPQWAGWLGVVLFSSSLWLLWRSHVDLGSNWSPKLEIGPDQTLVTGGVYSRIRHPMYAAHWLWALAQPLLLWNWVAGPAFLVALLPLYLVRVSREEQMMLSRFGEQYREYMDRTGRIIPSLCSRGSL
ncbi:MAG: isoprenylcysteine carboxylmethyltransferase family protein [Methanosarcinales archaeon]|nr:isoprenylcysteine carboxylmethyltransferase family protein [Methanosarcinales archaeon]